jgi:hypothetical protein
VNSRANKTYQPQWSKYKGEVEAHELKELEHGEDKIDEYEVDHRGNGAQELGYEDEVAYGDGDELGELECEYKGGRYELFELKYEGHGHGELMHEPKHDAEANYTEHNAETSYTDREPMGFNCDIKQMGEYTPHPHFFTPTPSLLPPHTLCVHNAPRSNQ